MSGTILSAPAHRVQAWIAAEALPLAGGGLAKKTFKRRLNALPSWYTDLGANRALAVNPRPKRVIAGASRYHGNVAKPQPLPITLLILRGLLNSIRHHPTLYGGLNASSSVIAASSLAFACFMRMGEFTDHTFDPDFYLRPDSIYTHSDGMTNVAIAAPKTDPLWEGRYGRESLLWSPKAPATSALGKLSGTGWPSVSRTQSSLPPAWSRFISTHGHVLPSMALTKAGHPSHLFSGHSFCRGVTTWEASIGMSGSDIKSMGQWKSDCYKLYVDAGPTRAATIGRALLNTPVSKSSLPSSGLRSAGYVWRPSLDSVHSTA
jgi:hypothetical protein